MDAIVRAVEAASPPVVLVVHSGAGAPGHEGVDRVPGRSLRRYVDASAASGPPNQDFDGVELPLTPRHALAAGENFDGLSDDQLARFRERALPPPAYIP